jgi:type II secretory pathway component GspD/PulD (secretin)
MQIHPSISEKSRTSISPDGESTKPIIDIREVDTMIDVRNGQTVVIAGLIVDKTIETRRSVPWLGDIPLLGWLFRYTSQETRKTELVMLITPYVLTDKTAAEIRKVHEQRIRNAGREFVPTPLPH